MQCPKCQSTRIIPIAYGFPDSALLREAERGKVKLGGCVIEDPASDRFCQDCEHEFMIEKVKRRRD